MMPHADPVSTALAIIGGIILVGLLGVGVSFLGAYLADLYYRAMRRRRIERIIANILPISPESERDRRTT